MVASISQTGNEWQEQTSGDFSPIWKLVSCLTVPGGSQHLVAPKYESCQCPPGVSGGWHGGFPFKCFLPDQREETGLGCQMAMPKKKATVREQPGRKSPGAK